MKHSTLVFFLGLVHILILATGCGSGERRSGEVTPGAEELDQLVERTADMYEAIDAGDFDQLQALAGPDFDVRATSSDPYDSAGFVWYAITTGELDVDFRNLQYEARIESNSSARLALVSVSGEMQAESSAWIAFRRTTVYEQDSDGEWRLSSF